MDRIELVIYDVQSGGEKVAVNKWKFQDTVMSEQFITATVTSEKPIDWQVGDYCVFRGETYTLNYTPTVTQKAPTNSVQDAYTYENVKFDSALEELTRCMMLDITPTTGDYIAALGTNYTGSSRFQLYCGETQTVVDGQTVTLTAVCALAAKIQANLDRLYPTSGWHVYVDTESTYTTATGDTVLVTHTDSKLLTFDNSTVAQALALVNTEFKLSYSVRGRTISIGYALYDLTGDGINDTFEFGYGKGYPSVDNPGKGLFQIKQIANSQQKIVTRLRALGSTKNMPYRYYHKRYAGTDNELSQALFPTNLQLPGTFLPEGQTSDAADINGSTKWAQNNARSVYLRKVLGDTNDAYIDKNDDAASCVEGIREDCARWDGSNSDLPEIYPTIEGMTFGELRDAGVPDQTGVTGQNAYQGSSVQPDEERIDNLLAIGYIDNGTLIDDANVGDGIMPENEVVDSGTHFTIGIGLTKLTYNTQSGSGDFEDSSLFLEGEERELFTVKDVTPGNYFMVPTGPSYSSVAYRFSLSSRNEATADVGFVISVKQKSGGTYSSIATWYSDRTTVGTATGEKEMYLPELPDVGTGGQVSALTISELSDVVVTFAPIIESISADGQISLTYQVGRSQSGEYDPEYTWCAVQGDTASKYPFHVFIKDMGFDLTATFNGETPVMSMRSGACVGREFEIGENVQKATVNGIRGYLLTLNRVEDSNLNIYYPNQYYPLEAGDYFVLLNINMPDAYIRAAELRLLKAATQYLADNCDTKFTYQPSIDDIYLQRNINAMAAAGTPEHSIFYRLYAGLRLKFNGIPASVGDPLPLVNMTIEQVTISMGEDLTPKVELVLNDDVQQTTLQKLTIAVDRIYNGSAFSSGGAGTGYEAIVDIGSRLFLSKVHDDIANGRITFNDIATFLELVKAQNGANFGEYLSGFLGNGAHIGADGKAEFEQVNVRGALRAAELVFNQISAEEGEAIRSIGHGEIETIDTENMTATLKLDGDQWATIDVGDICRGMYNTVNKEYDNAQSEGEDANGFRMKAGFFASYFKVEEILSSGKGHCTFRYSLQPSTTEHPCELMKFAVYGNTNNNKKERQSSMYITAVGIAPRMLFLAGVNDWQIKPYNIKVALGNINGVQVYEKTSGGSARLKELYGDAGLFVEDNIYFGGILNQFTSADWEYIQGMLGQGIHAQLLRGSDNIVVDALGNVVGGIVVEESEGGVVTNRVYKLHTGVLVYDSGKKRYLTAKGMDEGGTLGEDEFRLSYTCEGCEVMRDGADIYITRIDNLVSGGVPLTDAQLDLMRETSECRVNFVITTSSGWKTMMSYPVKITHLDYSYITFDLTNEMDSMAYRTQLKYYDGLPITTQLKAYANGEELGSDAFVSSTMVSENAFTGSHTAAGTAPARVYFANSGSKVRCSLTKDGVLTIDQVTERNVPDMEDTKYYIDISCVVKYAGVQYTSSYKRFVLTEATNATLYKLLLSANAVSKDEGTYTPSTIDVKAQIIDDSGTRVVAPNASGAVAEDVYVKYVNGPYDANSELLSTMPSFADVPVCVTVLLVDTSDGNTVLDVESVPMTAVGRNGAGQPWVKTNFDSFVIDCDHEGNVLEEKTITVTAELYWGDTRCRLNDSGCDIYLNGEPASAPDGFDGSGDNYVVAHSSFTFLEGSSLESTYINIFLSDYLGEHAASKTVPVIANKQGTQGATGSAGAALVFVGEWSEFGQYVWNENIRNAVKHDGLYWLVDVPSNGTEDLGEPSQENDKWLALTTLNITATNLLLAENASINLLSSNAINLFSGSVLTSSINADGKGSYVIYYPSRKKRMEFSYKGYIYYYNDDDDNSTAWKLGLGGEIDTSRSDDWQPFPLHKFNSGSSIVFNANTTFNRTVYLRFFAGSVGQYANYDGRVYDKKYNNPIPNGVERKYIEDGLYTPDEEPYQVLADGGSRFAITMYNIQDGEIIQEYEQFSA